MPFEHVFGSQIYYRKEESELNVGEQFKPVPWRGGLPPVPVNYGGLCGSADQWQNGALTTDPIPANWPGTTVPQCCSPPPLEGQGGIAIGGTTAILAPCLPNALVTKLLQMDAVWNGIGTAPPICTPWLQSICFYWTAGDEWQATGSYVSDGYSCFAFTWILTCPTGPNPQLNVGGDCPPASGDPPCFNNFSCTPCGNLLSVTSNPFSLTFGPADQTVSQWNWVFTNSSGTCLVPFPPACASLVGITRTMTLSGAGLTGSYSGTFAEGVFEFGSLVVDGSPLPLNSVLQNASSIEDPPYGMFLTSAPGSVLYEWTEFGAVQYTYSCNPFSVVFSFAGGPTVSIT